MSVSGPGAGKTRMVTRPIVCLLNAGLGEQKLNFNQYQRVHIRIEKPLYSGIQGQYKACLLKFPPEKAEAIAIIRIIEKREGVAVFFTLMSGKSD